MMNPGMMMPPTSPMDGRPMNGMIPSPYWPVLGQLPNGLHPPPPLIPVSGMSMMPPHMPMDLKPANLSPRGGDNSKERKCNLCEFKSESRDEINRHMLKVHAAENQDFLNIFGITSESLVEENAKTKEEPVKPDQSQQSPSEKPDTTINNSKLMPQNWGIVRQEMERAGEKQQQQQQQKQDQSMPANLHRMLTSGSEQYPNIPSPGGERIKLEMQQQPQPARRQNGDSPLDLTKAASHPMRPDFPHHGYFANNPYSFAHRMFEEQFVRMKQEEEMKKMRMEHLMAQAREEEAAARKRKLQMEAPPAEENSNQSGSNPSPAAQSSEATSPAQPRKRSRKGKAYKLDMISMKLQERGVNSPTNGDSGEEYLSDYDKLEIGDQTGRDESPKSIHEEGQGQGEEKVEGQSEGPGTTNIDYSEMHKSLREMNNERRPETEQHRFDGPQTPVAHHFERPLHESTPLGGYMKPQGRDYMPPQQQLPAMPGRDQNQPPNGQTTAENDPGILYSGNISKRKMFVIRRTEEGHRQVALIENGSGSGEESSEEANRDPPKDLATNQSQIPKGRPAVGSSYECNHCEIAFRDCIMYTMHMGYHGYQDPFKCNMCGHTAKDKVGFFLHIARAAHE